MVFESLVVELLNKYLGTFVENLDASQLSLGVWSGQATLENLRVKEAAFVDLGLPILVKSGHLAKLSLSIPWKNLYKEAVQVTIEGVYVVAVPSSATKYDPVKEKESKRRVKAKELAAIEEAQKLAAEKDKPKKKESDGFAVKMAMQIIRNLQVTVRDIHIRYEDPVTVAGHQLAYGVTLDHLLVQTTDSNWMRTFVTGESEKFWKILDMSCLSVYCDVDTPSLASLPRDNLQRQVVRMIARRNEKPPDLQYLIKPITIDVKLMINKNAGKNMAEPQVEMSGEIKELAVGLGRDQFQGSIQVIEAFDRMATNMPFRKYKPLSQPLDKPRQWWNYAIDSVLHEDVEPRLRQWSWEHISEHRSLCKRYVLQWKSRLAVKEPSKALKTTLRDLEDALDVFNITVCRKQAESEYKKETGLKKQKSGSGGWFSGWFGGGSSAKVESKETGLEKDFTLPPEEREKLYKAIGYVEGDRPGDLKPEYVARKVKFHLGQVVLSLHDSGSELVSVVTNAVEAGVQQRPGGDALRLAASIGSFTVRANESARPLVKSQSSKEGKLVDFSFEKNPLNAIPGLNRVKLDVQPVEVVANLHVIEKIVGFFDRPKDVELQMLSAAAAESLKQFKDNMQQMGRIQLTHALENRKLVDVQLDVHAPLVLIPEHGPDGELRLDRLIVLDLGRFRLKSKLQDVVDTSENLQSLSRKDLHLKMYDQFDIVLEQVQTFVAGPGDDWVSARSVKHHACHVLRPVEVKITLRKCLTDKNAQLPVIKVDGTLPELFVNISDHKIKQILAIVDSLPKPSPAEKKVQTSSDVSSAVRYTVASSVSAISSAVESPEDDDESGISSDEYYSADDCTEPTGSVKRRASKQKSVQDTVYVTQLQAKFTVKKVVLSVCQRLDNGIEQCRLEATVAGLTADLSKRHFDMKLEAKLAYIAVVEPTTPDPQNKEQSVHLVSSDTRSELITFELTQANPEAPDFKSKFGGVETKVKANVSALHVLAHQTSLINLLTFANDLQDLLPKKEPVVVEGKAEVVGDKKAETSPSAKGPDKSAGDHTQVQLAAGLHEIKLTLATANGYLAHAVVGGLTADLSIDKRGLQLSAALNQLSVLDSHPGAVHQTIVGLDKSAEEVIGLEFMKYNEATKGEKAMDMRNIDMKVNLTVGCLRFVFINRFLMDLLAFAKEFQLSQETLNKAKDAAAASAQAGLNAVQKNSAARILLDVSLTAPTVLLPVTSESRHVIMAQLGRLTVKNSFFSPKDAPVSDNNPVVVDDMSVKLEAAAVSRCELSEDGTAEQEHTLLHPLSMSVSVQRNLSLWYKDIPDVVVEGNMAAVKVQVIKEDIDFGLDFLNGNLKEGQPVTAPEPAADDKEKAEKAVDTKTKTETTVSTDVSPDHVKVKAKFKLEEVSLTVLEKYGGKERARLCVEVASLSTNVCIQPWDLSLDAALGFVAVRDLTQGTDGVYIVNSNRQTDLISVQIVQANEKGPEFVGKFAKTKLKLRAVVATLQITAHLETLLGLMTFADTLKPKSVEPTAGQKASSEQVVTQGERQVVARDNGKETDKEEQMAGVIDVDLQAELQSMTLLIASAAGGLADLSMNGIKAAICVSPEKTAVKASLTSLEVVDLMKKTNFPKILTVVESDDLVSVEFTQYNTATRGSGAWDMDKVDLMLSAKVAQVQVVFLNRFVQSLLVFASRFEPSEDTVNSAKNTAASAATASVEAVRQQSAKRISLDVHVSAPVVLMPQSSLSTYAIRTQLGVMSVKNTFLVEQSEDGQKKAVVDSMTVELSSVELARVELSGQKIVSRRDLLRPVSMSVFVERCLTSGYHHRPETKVRALLPDVQLHIGQSDLKTVLSILQDNMAEEPSIKRVPKPASQAMKRKVEKNCEQTPKRPASTSEPATGADDERSKLDASFQLKSIFVALYTESTTANGGDHTDGHDPECMLTSLALESLNVKADMKASGSLKANMSLADIVLTDKRPHRQKAITKMIFMGDIGKDLVPLHEEGTAHMISLDVSLHEEGDLIIITHVNGIQVLVYADFLLTLANFATAALPEKVEKEESSVDSTDAAKEETSVPAVKAAAETDKEEKSAPRRLSLHVTSARLILVEDANNWNSRALILKSSLSSFLNQSALSSNISGHISHLSMVSCRLENRIVHNEILEPTSAELVLAMSPSDKSMNISFVIPTLVLNVDPTVVSLLDGVVKTLQQRQENITSETEDIEETVPPPAGLWKVEPLNLKRWYFERGLAKSEGSPVDDEEESESTPESSAVEECTVDITRFELVVQYDPSLHSSQGSRLIAKGRGQTFVPLLAIVTSLSAKASNWSSSLSASVDVTVQTSCYNSKMAAWEALLEPVELLDGSYRPWLLHVEVSKPEEPKDSVDGKRRRRRKALEKAFNEEDAEPPLMSVNLSSKDDMRITVTRSMLKVLQLAGDVFSSATAGRDTVDAPPTTLKRTDYNVVNQLETGLLVEVGDMFEPIEGDSLVGAGGELELSLTKAEKGKRRHDGTGSMRGSVHGRIKGGRAKTSKTAVDVITVTVIGGGKSDLPVFESVVVSLSKCGLFHFRLKPNKGDRDYFLVCQIDVSGAEKIITFRSAVQVYNHLDVPLDVLFAAHVTSGSRSAQVLSTIHPEQLYSAPLGIASVSDLLFQPTGMGFGPSATVSWTMKEEKKLLECQLANSNALFGFWVVKEEQHYLNKTVESLQKSPRHIFHVHPSLALQNLLPYDVNFSFRDDGADRTELREGERRIIYTTGARKFRVRLQMKYLNTSMEGSFDISPLDIKQYTTFVMKAVARPADSGQEYMVFSVACHLRGALSVAIYAPYWIINQTGQELIFQPKDSMKPFTVWPPDGKNDPTLFGFSGEDASKIKLRCGKSSLSDAFSLNTAGSEGSLSCVNGNYKMEFGVKVTIAHFTLTKLVFLTPYNLLVNKTKSSLIITDKAGYRVRVEAEATCGFFPESSSNTIRAKVDGDTDFLKAVDFHRSGMTLLLRNNKSVLCVTVEVATAVTTITFDEYFRGACPALVQNHCKKTSIVMHQAETRNEIRLGPGQQHFFTWNDPTGKRELVWRVDGTTTEKSDDVMENDRGKFSVSKGAEVGGVVHWVNIMDGLQRLLLFTPNADVADVAFKNDLVERASQEIFLSLHGINLSLVNDNTATEVAYIGLVSSNHPIWQVERKKMWKTLKLEDCHRLEKGNIQGKMERGKDFEVVGKTDDWVMKKPIDGRLRRTFHEAVSVTLTLSPHQMKVKAAVNNVQIDNQMPAAIFPGVLFTIPPPRTVALEEAPKPFFEFSLLHNTMEDSKTRQIKYMKLLIQELHFKVDIAFVMALARLFASDVDPNQMAIQHAKTAEMVTVDLSTTAAVQALKNNVRIFFDYLHLSPLKVHVSFSLQEADKVLVGAQDTHAEFIVSLLHSVGVTLSEASDIQLKMAYFEVNSEVLTQTQLTSQIIQHYMTQAVNQLYVLVLGLDVLGNPFGLVRGMKDGVVDLFYEPYKGAIQGPEELVNGLVLGGRSFFSAAVGGVFGAVSRITGSLGKGVAHLTLDDQYIEERRRQQGQPTGAASGVALGVKGFGKGLFKGITGVVTKPVEGAKSEGGVGFLKGLGRGLIGAVARPVGGVIDLASNTFEGIKKSVEVSEGEWQRLRPRRPLTPDSAVLTYSTSYAYGLAYMDAIRRSETMKGSLGSLQFQESTLDNPHFVIIVTSLYVILVKVPPSFISHDEPLDPEWYCRVSDLREPPYVLSGTAVVVIKCTESKEAAIGPIDFISGPREQKLKTRSRNTAEVIVRRFEAFLANQ